MAELRVEVDREKCLGSGMCVFAAPTVFDQDDDTGIAVVDEHALAEELIDKLRYAEATCPGQAIKVFYGES